MNRDELVKAGISALYDYAGREADAVVTDSGSARQVSTLVVDAVVPLIEADLRERLARQIEAGIRRAGSGQIITNYDEGRSWAARIVRGASADTPREDKP